MRSMLTAGAKVILGFFFGILIVHLVRYFGQRLTIVVALMTLVSLFVLLLSKARFSAWSVLSFCAGILIGKILLIINFPVVPVSDFATIMDASEALAMGNTDYKNTEYFTTWGFNIGQVIYQSLILRIFNSNATIHILNALYNVISLWMTYLIAKKLYSSWTAVFSTVIFGLMFFNLSYSGIASNQHLFMAISLLAVYRYIVAVNSEAHKTFNYLLVGILLAIANIIRPEAAIFILAIIIDQVVNQKNDLKTVKRLVILLISYVVLGLILGQVVILAGISNVGFKNNNPWFKFRTGLNLQTIGGYSDSDQKIVGEIAFARKISMDEADKILLLERLQTPEYNLVSIGKLVIKKIAAMWTGGRLYWFNESAKLSSKLIEFLEKYDNAIIFVLAILGIFSLFYKKLNVVHYALFFTVVIYALIEIQTRYALTSFYLMAILTPGGLEFLHISILTHCANKSLRAVELRRVLMQ